MAKNDLTPERLRELLSYDPETGVFTRLIKTSANAPSGMPSGCLAGSGYIYIRIDRELYRAHRLVWLYVHGRFPIDHMDHINGIRNDNRLSNLRECSNAQNRQNMLTKVGASGFVGVFFREQYGNYYAKITYNRKQKNLGVFPTAEEAHAAYVEAKARLHTFQPTIRTNSQ